MENQRLCFQVGNFVALTVKRQLSIVNPLRVVKRVVRHDPESRKRLITLNVHFKEINHFHVYESEYWLLNFQDKAWSENTTYNFDETAFTTLSVHDC